MIITDKEILKKKSEKVEMNFDIEPYKDIFKNALSTAWVKGFGLAGVQIGVHKRIAWYKIKDKEVFLINPIIINQSRKFINGKEGCLSIPDKWFKTERYYKITVNSDNMTSFEAVGTEAVIIQHEIDHMDGILCSDREYKDKIKTGRNDMCHCGSGKKYKKCCILFDNQPTIFI